MPYNFRERFAELLPGARWPSWPPQMPFVDFHQMNLDWILEAMRAVLDQMKYYFIDGGSKETIEKVMEEHPEWWPRVQDGAITEPKINGEFLKEIKNRYVTVEMFGGVGDGSTDDSAALASATASGYPVCLLPDKTYRINSTVNLTTSAVIFGCGELSELLIDRDGSVNTDANTDHTLELCEFKCTVRKVHGNGINITKTNDANAKNRISIHDMVFYMDNDIDTNLDSIMVYLKGVREASITNCVFKGDSSSYGTGLYMTADSTHLTMNIAVSECNFYYLKKCIDLDNTAANLIYLAGIRMVDNMFIGAKYGLHAKYIDTFFLTNSMFDFITYPVISDSCPGIKIGGNYIQTSVGPCIHVKNNSPAECRHGEINNNYIWSTASGLVVDGIVMEGITNKNSFWTVSGNKSTHLRTMVQMKNCQNCEIFDNMCHEATTFFDGNNDSSIITLHTNKCDSSVNNFSQHTHPATYMNNFNWRGTSPSIRFGNTEFTGDGVTTSVDISTSLFARASTAGATMATAAPGYHVEIPDNTHIRIVFDTAPNNGQYIVIRWYATV